MNWLKNAHAMEVGLAEVLDQHARDAEKMPHVKARLSRHAAETRIQASRLEQLLERLGSSVSPAKTLLSQWLGHADGFATAPFQDKLLKNALLDYAAEQFEMACYNSLITAAEELGELEVIAVCRENLAEERGMAQWLEQQVPVLTRAYLHQQALSQPA